MALVDRRGLLAVRGVPAGAVADQPSLTTKVSAFDVACRLALAMEVFHVNVGTAPLVEPSHHAKAVRKPLQVRQSVLLLLGV